MNDDNQSDNNDDLQEGVEGAISDPDGAAASAKDAAAGAADSAKDMLSGAKDKLPDNPLSGKAAGAAAGAAGLVGGLKGKAGDLLGKGGDVADVDVPDVDLSGGDAGSTGGVASSLKDRAAAAKANMADAAGSAKDKAAGAADGAKGAVSGAADGVTGKASGATGGVKGAAGAAAAGVGGLAGSMKDKAAGAADSAKGAASGVTDGVKGAASGVSGKAKGAAGAATAGAAGVAASASDKVSAASSSASDAVAGATTSVSGGGSGGSTGSTGGGSGGSGSGGGSGYGGGGSDDDDDEGIIPGLPISGEWQIIGLGLLVASFFLFGSTIWGWISGEDDLAIGDAVESIAMDPQCEAIFNELRSSELEADSYSDLSCSVVDGEPVVSGVVESNSARTAVAAVIAGASVEAGSRLTVVDDEPAEVEEVAAEAPTTTAAPATTTEAPTTTAAPTTTVAETTTTEAPPEPTNMWDALNDSGQAGQLVAIGSALGLQESLEGVEPPQRTLFAPSDAALGSLDPATLNAVAADPDRAGALFGYHIVPGALTAEDVAALDGTSVNSLTELPLDITVVDGEVFINGDTKVIATDYTADNGIVHIIDTVLTPPTVNEVIGLENIEFEVNSDVITAAGQAELQKAVAFFTESANTSALIEGHTDTDGPDADNLDLSERRAASVKQFLVDNGIDGERLTTQGFGETQPILVDGVEDKPASRRIEFRVR